MTDDANINGILSAVRTLLIVSGTALAAHGLASSKLYFWVQLIAGSIMIVGPAVWGVWIAVVKYRNDRRKAVQAGVNLAVSASLETCPSGIPVPVTNESAAKIVQNFAKAS